MSRPIVLEVEGNTAPSFLISIKRDGKVVKLFNSPTVSLEIKKPSTGDQTNAGHEQCTIIDADLGQVRYTPQPDDFDTFGRYLGTAFVMWAGALEERFFTQVTIVVRPK